MGPFVIFNGVIGKTLLRRGQKRNLTSKGLTQDSARGLSTLFLPHMEGLFSLHRC